MTRSRSRAGCASSRPASTWHVACVDPGRNRKRTADATDAAADFSGFDSVAPNEKANRPKHVQFRPLVVLAFGRDQFDLQVLRGGGCLALARRSSRAGFETSASGRG